MSAWGAGLDEWAEQQRQAALAQQQQQAQAATTPAQPVSLSGAGAPSAYEADPTGTGPAQGDTTQDNYGQAITTHYNPMYHATDATAQNLASQYGGVVISAPEREAGGGTPESPWNMPNANYIRTANGAIANAGQLQKYIDAFGPVVGAKMIREELAGDTPEALAKGGASGADYWYQQYGNNPAIPGPGSIGAPPQPPPGAQQKGMPGDRGGPHSLPPETPTGGAGSLIPGRASTLGRTPPSLSGSGNPASSNPGGGRQMPTNSVADPASAFGGAGAGSPGFPGRTQTTGTTNPAGTPSGGRTVTPSLGITPPTIQPPSVGKPSGQPSFPGTAGLTPSGTPVQAGANPAFPNWSAGDGTGNQAYNGGDPGFMASALQNRAIDYGNNFEGDYGNAYRDAQTQSRQYQDQSDNAYNWLNENPGYNADEAAGITQEGRLTGAQTTQGEFDSNQLTDAERAAMIGDAGSVSRAFDPSTITSTSKAGTDWTQKQYQDSSTAAHNALDKGESTANATLSDYGSRLRGTVDPAKLGISDATVAGLKDQAGRQIGLQYGAAQDQLQRQAEAAGNVNPLSLAAARERLLRSSSIDQADAVTNADLSAREAQRQANVGIAGMQQSNENALGNAGLNTNLSLAGLRTGTEAAYGTLGANVGATANAQNTAATEAAGNTAIQQAGYVDTANAARNAAVAQNRQTTNQANQAAKYQQGYNTATSLSGANKAIGDARIQGQQAARNYWQGQGQFQGAQANAASSSRISGAQTSLSGQGQGAQVAANTEIGRRSTRPVSIGPGGITVGI